MNDKEKLEAIGRRVDGVNYSITLLVNDIKKILEADKGFICSKCGKESSSLRHGLCVICTKF